MSVWARSGLQGKVVRQLFLGPYELYSKRPKGTLLGVYIGELYGSVQYHGVRAVAST